MTESAGCKADPFQARLSGDGAISGKGRGLLCLAGGLNSKLSLDACFSFTCYSEESSRDSLDCLSDDLEMSLLDAVYYGG